ncbi:MAG: OmpA family protein [Bacteroidales bacterium]|nr:OmpA family protein [Bacteroidales bacterium]
MKKLLILLAILAPLSLLAQRYTTSNAKAIKMFEKGKNFLYQSRGDEAVKCFYECLSLDPDMIEADIILAEWFFDAKDYAKSKQHYYAVVQKRPDFFTIAWMQLGDLELNDGNYGEAKANYEQFLKLDRSNADRHKAAEQGIRCADFRAYAVAHPVDFEPVNLGPDINTKDDEYLPALTVDGLTLIYTRRFPRTRNTIPGLNEEEDFYISSFKDGSWTPSRRMAEPVNSFDNEGAQCISQDGRIMFFTACGRRDGAGRCDLYMCTRKGDRWSTPRNLGPAVNTGAWESQPSFSIDGKTLYFVSDRAGGYGGMDIWKTVYGQGGWSEPVNLGPTINTSGNEMSPFIHYDDQTLYFSSNGHPGMGDMDLFCSRRQEDGTWGKPTNLGFPINTDAAETNLIVSADGHTAYYSSDREGGYGKQDLYSFVLPVEQRPVITLCMKGSVADAKTGNPLSAQIQVKDMTTGNIVASTSSDSHSGLYQVSLPSGLDYVIHATAKGYLFYSETYRLNNSIDEDWTWKADTVDIAMVPIEAGQRIALKNVFFETNKSEILEASEVELNTIVDILQKNPTLHVELGGHTDNVGSPAANQKLSEQRAFAVYSFLIQQGIPAERLTYKGYGESQPVADNGSEEGRQQNRRTEMKVM